LKLKKLADNLLNCDVSPGLIDDEKLQIMPKTYFVVCEMDSLKDEAIIFSERLKKAGVAVEVAYYETGYHRMINATQKNIYFNRISSAMVDDIVRYIHRNLENL
jgi:acetyl esterase/lipase